MTDGSLEKQLSEARGKLAQLRVTLEKAEGECRTAASELGRLRAAWARAEEDQVLVGTTLDPALPRAVAAAEKEFAELEGRAGVYRRSAQRQTVTVEDIVDAISAGRREAFQDECAKPAAEVRKLVARLADLMSQSSSLAIRHGQDNHSLTAALFPLAADGATDGVRDASIGVASAALLLNQTQAVLGRKAA